VADDNRTLTFDEDLAEIDANAFDRLTLACIGLGQKRGKLKRRALMDSEGLLYYQHCRFRRQDSNTILTQARINGTWCLVASG